MLWSIYGHNCFPTCSFSKRQKCFIPFIHVRFVSSLLIIYGRELPKIGRISLLATGWCSFSINQPLSLMKSDMNTFLNVEEQENSKTIRMRVNCCAKRPVIFIGTAQITLDRLNEHTENSMKMWTHVKIEDSAESNMSSWARVSRAAMETIEIVANFTLICYRQWRWFHTTFDGCCRTKILRQSRKDGRTKIDLHSNASPVTYRSSETERNHLNHEVSFLQVWVKTKEYIIQFCNFVYTDSSQVWEDCISRCPWGSAGCRMLRAFSKCDCAL